MYIGFFLKNFNVFSDIVTKVNKYIKTISPVERKDFLNEQYEFRNSREGLIKSDCKLL